MCIRDRARARRLAALREHRLRRDARRPHLWWGGPCSAGTLGKAAPPPVIRRLARCLLPARRARPAAPQWAEWRRQQVVTTRLPDAASKASWRRGRPRQAEIRRTGGAEISHQRRHSAVQGELGIDRRRRGAGPLSRLTAIGRRLNEIATLPVCFFSGQNFIPSSVRRTW